MRRGAPHHLPERTRQVGPVGPLVAALLAAGVVLAIAAATLAEAAAAGGRAQVPAAAGAAAIAPGVGAEAAVEAIVGRDLAEVVAVNLMLPERDRKALRHPAKPRGQSRLR